jgi:single-stranded DNA-binding protein
MSVAVLISGSIFKEPQERTSQSGKRYVVTTVKTGSADNTSSEFWSVLAFGDTAGAELLRLAIGERVTIQGGLKLEIFEKDGQARISRTIFADHAMALRQPPKERKKAPPAGSKAADRPVKESILPPSDESSTESAPSSFYSDDIPFLMEWRG